jgi:predicted N-acetyltransferase YhbS
VADGPAAHEARIRPAEPGDLDAILELMSASLGDALPRERDFFTWKHHDNPFGASLVLVAEDDEGLVGLRAMLRWTFQAGDQIVHAARPVDTAVHPRFRRRGLFSSMTRQALAILPDLGVSLVYNTPNDKSRPGYLKLGWEPVGKPTVWVRPGGRFSLFGGQVRGAVEPFDPPEVQDRRLHTVRDAAYLKWRYADTPAVAYGMAREQDCAVVFRQRDRFGRLELTVTDVLCPRAALPRCARLLREAVREGTENHALAMAVAGTRESVVLALAGFVPVPRGGPLLVRRAVEGMSVPLDPQRLSNWRPQVGDLELF